MPVTIAKEKCSCGHLSSEHWNYPDHSCQKCSCKKWTYSEVLDSGPKLLERLRKYQEARPNSSCKRIFDLSDVEDEDIDGKNQWRIKCRDCGEIFSEKILHGRDNKISDFIDALERDIETDRKIIVTDAK